MNKKEERSAFVVLKEFQKKGIRIYLDEKNRSLSFSGSNVTDEQIQELADFREDIIFLLQEDEERFKPPSPIDGPGTELKRLLSKIGIHSKANCSCNKRAYLMDEKGNNWVEANIDMVADWLGEEAKKRRIHFLKAGAKILIRKAISNSRKKQKAASF